MPFRAATGLLPARLLPFDECEGLEVTPIDGELLPSPLPMANQRFMCEPHHRCGALIRGHEQPRLCECIHDRTGFAAGRKAVEWGRTRYSNMLCTGSDRRQRA